MPAKRKCQAQIIVSAPSLPASTTTIHPPSQSSAQPAPASSSSSSASASPEAPRSPGGTPITKELPATEASKTFVGCPHPAQRIVGDCNFCHKSFCGNHRLPEQHGCSNLQHCRDAAHAANKAKLESERTIVRKIGAL